MTLATVIACLIGAVSAHVLVRVKAAKREHIRKRLECSDYEETP